MMDSLVMLDRIYAWIGWDIYMSNKFLTYITCSFRWCLEIGFIGLLVTLRPSVAIEAPWMHTSMTTKPTILVVTSAMVPGRTML